MIRAYAKAWFKFKKRLAYDHPIFSVVDYFVRLVVEDIQPSYDNSRSGRSALIKVGDSETTYNTDIHGLFATFKELVMG